MKMHFIIASYSPPPDLTIHLGDPSTQCGHWPLEQRRLPPGRRSPPVTCCALSLEDRRGSRPRRPLSPSLCTPRAGTTQYRATFSLRIQESSSVRAQKMSLAAPPKTLRGARSCSSAIRIGPPWVPLPQVDFCTQCLCRGALDALSSREEA